MIDVLTITNKLIEVEEKENVRILLAVEAGSRAWGYASDDSDYDVRFIYVRPKEEYLKLSERRDVIEWQLDENVDMNGWDLKKALLLLRASNPTLFEWAASPICYQTSDYWRNVSKEINNFFRPRAGFFHYLGMAKTTYKKFLQNEPIFLKKYFHAVRSILAAKYILENETPPPVCLTELMRCVLKPGELPSFTDLYVKKSNNELEKFGLRIPELDAYIWNSIALLDHAAPDITSDRPLHWQLLDQMFLDGLDAFYQYRQVGGI